MNAEFTVIHTETADQWKALKHEVCSQNVTITDDGIELLREDIPTYVAPSPIGQESLASIISCDIDVDRSGARYVLDADGALYRAKATEKSFTRLECDDLTAREAVPSAFCIAGDVIYVVGTRPNKEGTDGDSGYVQTLSTHRRQTRWIVDRVDDIPFSEPIRVVQRRSKPGVYVLDCGPTTDEGFVAHVNDDGTARIVMSGLQQPRDITVDERGDLFVLDTEKDTLVLRKYSASTGTSSSAQNEGKDNNRGEKENEMGDEELSKQPLEDVTCIEAVGGGGFVIGVGPKASGERMLYKYVTTGKSVETLTRETLETLSSFQRGCTRLRRGGEGDAGPLLYAIDDCHNVWLLEPTYAVKRREGCGEEHATECDDCWNGEYAGQFVGRFDLGMIGTKRCRVHLEYGDVPPGTRVILRYITTDQDISEDDWTCRCGNECNCGSDDHCIDGWQFVPAETSRPSDVLLELSGHRFLWLGLELVGSQFAAPTVRSMKVSLSHESYIHYLPTIYREDEPNAIFLERFLSIFEDTFGDIDHAITTLTRYFDPESIPSHLSWLGSWLAIAEDESWSEQSKRQLIAEAPNLFKKRGTRGGLLRLLEIYLDGEEESLAPWENVPGTNDKQEGKREVGGREEDEKVDHFVFLLEYRDIIGNARSSDENEIEAEEAEENSLTPFRGLLCCPQEFVVLVGPTVGENAQKTVERIIESERPAHTLGRTVSLRSWGRLGDHVYLGMNSYLPPREFVVDESRLGWDSVVDKRGSDSQLGDLSRLGVDAELT